MSLDKEMFQMQENLFHNLELLRDEMPKHIGQIKKAMNQRQILDYKNNLVALGGWLATCSEKLKKITSYYEARSINSEVITFKFNNDTGKRLIEIAKEQNTTIDDIVGQALLAYIKSTNIKNIT